MDKKLLDALNNLSVAFEELAKAISNASADKDKSATSTALAQTKIEKKLELIDKGVQKLQADNKKIIKNQEQLLKLAQSAKSKPTPMEQAGDKKQKSKIKDGVAIVLLIAVGVLAIGLAFKLIGKVNFATVIALSIALPLLAFAFEKMAKNKRLNPARMITLTKVLVIMAAAIAATSFILQLVRPVGFFKLFTAIMISAAFVGISYALPKLTRSFAKMSGVGFTKFILFGPLILLAMSVSIALSSRVLGFVKPVGIFKLFTAVLISAAFVALSFGLPRIVRGFGKISLLGVGKFLIFGPAVLATMALAIALSSRFLGLVKPVGFFKLFTAIMIAAAFGAIGFGLGKIMEGFKKSKLKPDEAKKIVPLIPIVFIALAVAIAGASWVFQKIKPVGLFKLITAALIGVVFIPLGYALVPIAKAMRMVRKKDALMMPVILVALALTIMLTSYLFKQTLVIPAGKLLNILLQAGLISGLGFVMAKLLPRLAKIPINTLLKGGLVIIAIAATVVIVSAILSVGSYKNYPDIFWITGVAASLGAFGAGASVIGFQALNPFFYAGLGVILVLAGTVLATSLILANGKYEKYPTLIWNLYTLGTIGAFGAMATTVGILAPVIVPGSLVILLISAAIVATDKILAQGEYDKYPDPMWILFGLGAVTAFGMLATGVGIFAPFVVVGSALILVICAAILATDLILAQGKYDMYPSLDWAKGALGSIAAVAAVASGLAVIGLVALVGIPFMLTIAGTIVAVSKELAKGNYAVPGFVDWINATVLMYTTFVPILGVLAGVALMNKVAKFFGSDPFGTSQVMLISVAKTIVKVANELKKGTFVGGPTKQWAEGVSIAIGAFAPIYSMLVQNMKTFTGGVGPADFAKAIKIIVGGIKYAALQFDGFAQYGYPTEKWAKGVGTAIGAFAPVFDILTKSKDYFWKKGPSPEDYKKAIFIIAQGIVDAAEFFSMNKGVFDLRGIPSKKWGERVGAAISAFAPALEFIGNSKSALFGVDPEIIEKGIKSTAMGMTLASIILSMGTFGKYPGKEWSQGVGDAIKSFVYLAAFIYNRMDWLPDALFYMRIVQNSMLNTAKKFSEIGRLMTGVDPNWMKNVTKNVIRYVVLADYLAKSKTKYSTIDRAVWGMRNLASSYSDLAYSISKLNAQLEELDVDKLNALRNLNASVVLMSLMDPKNFKEMMDELEAKGGVLIDAFKQSEEGKKKKKDEKGKKGATGPQLKSGEKASETQERSMSDVYSILEAVDDKLGKIAKSSDKISKYVDEIRGDSPLTR